MPEQLLEVWRSVIGHDGCPDNRYEVSNLGNVRTHRNRLCKGTMLMKLSLRSKHCKYLSVRIDNRTRYVHQLVALSFLGPRPDGMQVNHKDTNKFNNAATNLEYVTQQKNIEHAIANGLWPQVFVKGSNRCPVKQSA